MSKQKNKDQSFLLCEKIKKLTTLLTQEKQTEQALRSGIKAYIQREKVFRQLFDNIKTAVAVYKVVDNGKDFVFADFNHAAEKIDKIKKEQLIGKKVSRVFPGVKEFGLFDVFKRVWKTGKPEHHPVGIYKDKRIQGWRENYVYKIPSGEIIAVYEDATARKQAEQQMKELARFPKENPNLVLRVTFQGEVIFKNKAVDSVLKSLRVNQKDIKEILPKNLAAIIRKARKNKRQSVNSEVSIKGKTYFYAISVGAQDANIYGFDITERKKTEKELYHNSKQLQVLNENLAEGMVYQINSGKDGLSRKFSYLSPAVKKLHGLEPREVIANPRILYEQVIEPDRSFLAKKEKHAFETMSKLEAEVRMRLPSGDIRWRQFVSTPRIMEGVVLWDGIELDITERKQAELKYKTILDTAIDCFYIINARQGNILEVNDAYCSLIGYSRDELLKMSLKDIEYKENPKKIARHMRYIIKKGADHFETRHRAKEGRIIDLETSVNYMKENKKFFVFMHDITERKKYENDLKKAKEEIEKWNKELEKRVREKACALKEAQEQLFQADKLSSIGQLGAGIAHELNSPLAGLLSLIRAYKKKKNPDTDEYAELAEMESACEYMARIVRDLNLFSRQTVGETEKANLNELIEATMSFSMHQLKAKNIIIIKNYSQELAVFLADKRRVQQVIINLLANACDALSERGILTITTGNINLNGQVFVELEVADNGCGIKKTDIKKIFEPFFTTKRPGKGVGLGLAVVYSIVEKHKGRIFVKSKEGAGTTFTVQLPALVETRTAEK
ncbi:MAG: PAS domain S-box protein [Candidatus Omnitrophica bacterium]|nr:PAS domain S-box protein [Candidatus Omnitrophota bacterium]